MQAARLSRLGIVRASVLVLLDGGPPACCCLQRQPLKRCDADLDALLDAVTTIKAQQKELEQQLEPLLEALNAAMASGQLDPSFSHNDWAFCPQPRPADLRLPGGGAADRETAQGRQGSSDPAGQRHREARQTLLDHPCPQDASTAVLS